MHQLRKASIEKASNASLFGIILGTLGRQGNPAIVSKIQTSLRKHGKRSYIVLFSEISPAKLSQMEADVWVQVACPRLSVDWGHQLSDRPVLSPYELFVLLGETSYSDSYPMDYYSMNGGPWSNYHEDNRDRQWKVSYTFRIYGIIVCTRTNLIRGRGHVTTVDPIQTCAIKRQ
jgi:2-(3-amino-3-carboxypropyl)histidine synthase